MAAQKKSPAAKAPKPASPVKNAYLVLYNALSAAAWSVVLYRTVTVALEHDPKLVHAGVGEWTKWTQTGALLEVLHSLLGRPLPVRASIILLPLSVSRFGDRWVDWLID